VGDADKLWVIEHCGLNPGSWALDPIDRLTSFTKSVGLLPVGTPSQLMSS